jgi:GNAT superfamily N-acetyltransferase
VNEPPVRLGPEAGICPSYTMEVGIRICTGREVTGHVADAARLRISVFRDFPYLYRGDEASERDYLLGYAACEGSVFVLAEALGTVVGVSTGLPLASADGSFRKPFESAGMDHGEWFYFGESVLDPAWRGRGLGHRFFDAREAHARGLGFERTCFCAVERTPDHPLRPADYRPHDVFWGKRGYLRRPELRARFAWRQVDSPASDVANELVFWTREVAAQM